jgi:hypothetical protein
MRTGPAIELGGGSAVRVRWSLQMVQARLTADTIRLASETT